MKWLAAALMLTFSTAASAANSPFVVDSSADLPHVDINPAGGNTCQAIGNVCTLRAAIQAANANPGADEITFAITGSIGLGHGQANEDSAVGGDLDIRCSASGCMGESLTITGNAMSLTAIEAMGLPDRAFDIVDDLNVTIQNIQVSNTNFLINIGDGTAIRNNGKLTLENVTVRGSAGVVVATTTEVTVEGAILNSGTMTLNNVRVEDNTGNGINAGPGKIIATNLTASGNTVAGLRTTDSAADVRLVDSTLTQNAIGFWSSAGRATIEGTLGGSPGCEISENDSTEAGFVLSGGVLNQSLLRIERCEISSNRNQSTGGGGILNLGTLELLDSQVTGNSVLAGQAGGGLQNEGRAVVRGSLFETNAATMGGGIGNFGTLMVVNSTVSGNAGSGISTQDGAAALASELRLYSSTVVENETADLHQTGTANLIDVRNSIVSVCLVPTGLGVIESLGFNFEAALSCGFEATNDVQSITDLVGGTIEATLAMNGGFTETHKLLTGAPTSGIDLNDSVSCPSTDQRGMPRALGSCDVGAYEAVSLSQCEDGIDNDADGSADFPADDGCTSASDNLEQTLVNGTDYPDGTIFAASYEGSAVFAIPADYVDPGLDPLPPVLTRGSGLAGPISATGNGTEILVLDAFQGLVFQIDLETGIPSVFGSTGALDFPMDLAYGVDGDVFVVGRVTSGTATIVRIDPDTRLTTTVTHTPQLIDLQSIDIDENDDLIVSSKAVGAFRVVLDEAGDGVATEIGDVSDPSGLAIRRTGDLLVVNRETNEVVALSPAGAGASIGIESMLLETPRGIGIEREIGIEIGSEKRVQVTMIVSERDGSLHRIAWDGTTATETAPVLAENLPKLFGLWILRDQDADGILDSADDSDSDGLFDNFETGTGISLDADHAGTDPNNDDTDSDNLLDGFEAVNGGFEAPNGIDPNNDDTDGDSILDGADNSDADSFTNFEEQMAGTDPNDSGDFLFAEGIPAVGPYGIWILAPLLLLASRFMFGWRAKLRG